jgi:hypothetical protein
METLGTRIATLADNSDLKLDSLPEDLRKVYDGVESDLDNLEETEREEFLDNVLGDLYKPTRIRPGTLGAYIFACETDINPDFDKSCNIYCIEGIKRKRSCKSQVWKQEKGGVEKVNKVKNNSPYAILYTRGNVYTPITGQDVKNLKKNGVSELEVVESDDTKLPIINERQPLENYDDGVPKGKRIRSKGKKGDDSGDDDDGEHGRSVQGGGNGIYIAGIGLVLVIVIALIAGVYYYQCSKKRQQVQLQ